LYAWYRSKVKKIMVRLRIENRRPVTDTNKWDRNLKLETHALFHGYSRRNNFMLALEKKLLGPYSYTKKKTQWTEVPN
jgi:hypothetical protein